MNEVLYRSVAGRLRELIKNRQPGESLPPERDLVSNYNVSRVTVRKALKLLVDEGLLTVKQGSGYVVAYSLVQQLSRITSFSEDCHALGMKPGSIWVEAKEAILPPDVALAFGLSIADSALCLKRIRLADASPVAFETAWVPKGLISQKWKGESLYKELRDNGLTPVRLVQKLKPIMPSAEISESLKISSEDPVMYVNRVAYSADNNPLEFVEGYFRPDRWQFVSEVR